MLKSFSSIVLTIIALTVAVSLVYLNQDRIFSSFRTQNTKYRGVVLDNNNDCGLNDTCLLRLSIPGARELDVYYRGGGMDYAPPKICENHNVPLIAKTLTTGDLVEVYGKPGGTKSQLDLEVCSKPEFYIKNL